MFSTSIGPVRLLRGEMSDSVLQERPRIRVASIPYLHARLRKEVLGVTIGAVRLVAVSRISMLTI